MERSGPFGAITSAFHRLSARERMLALGAGVAAVFLTALLLFVSVSGSIRDRESRIGFKREGLTQVMVLSSGFREAQGERDRLESQLRRSANVSLVSMVESLAQGQGIKPARMNPRRPATNGGITEQSLDVTFEGISIAQVANLVNAVQKKPELVKIRKLRIRKKFGDEEKVDVSLSVSSYGVSG